jgi:uncharacterized membrane protein YcaP (DUF421 family)
MESVLRAVSVYLFLLLIFRLVGRRALQKINTFDFVLMLVIGSVMKDPLLGGDTSMTNAFAVASVLVLLNVLFSFVKLKLPKFAMWIDGVPMIVVVNGRFIQQRMHKSRLTEDDVMQAARERKGIESLDQIKYAILEKNGSITVVAFEVPEDNK